MSDYAPPLLVQSPYQDPLGTTSAQNDSDNQQMVLKSKSKSDTVVTMRILIVGFKPLVPERF